MGMRIALLTAVFASLLVHAARADDYGPARDVRQVRSNAIRLLAHRVRQTGVDPKNITIGGVTVAANEATVSWTTSRESAVMHLTRREDRWWDAQAPQENDGYLVAIHFSATEIGGDVKVTRLYARAPTHAEFLPNPPPPKNWGGPTDVGFFDVEIGGTKSVTFSAGTAIDVWVPFVLDDTLRYDLSFFSDDKPYGPYRGTIFDNVLHFELPAFTLTPGKQLAAEISGWY